MKTILLISSILVFSCMKTAFSQIWGKPNAVWTYCWGLHGLTVTQKITYSGDTIIDNQPCMKLTSIENKIFTLNQEGDQSQYTSAGPTYFTYVSGDTVFYKTHSGFEILYNFAAAINEEWIVERGPSGVGCDTISKVKVVQKGQENINGLNMIAMEIRDVNNTAVGINSKVLSKIGAIGNTFLFPTGRNCDSTIVDFYQYYFVCFEDEDLFYRNPTLNHCGIYLDVPTVDMSKINVYPNPVSELLNIDIPTGNYSYKIHTLSGKEIVTGILKPSDNSINVVDAQKGIYFLSLTSEDGQTSTLKFMKQ